MELVTKAERELIERRLAELIANRPQVAQRIAEARAHGDLRENGDYHAAREQQGMEEAEIRRLQERLSNIAVISDDVAKAAEGVIFIGSVFKLKDVDRGDIDTYKLVGDSSSINPDDDIVEVTATSPMGEALFKAKVGDIVRVQAPRGMKRFEVIELL